MLHFEAIEPITLSILKELMALPSMNSFALTGGTALALKYGHRQSVDLDLFSHNYLDQSNIRDELIDQFGSQILFDQMLAISIPNALTYFPEAENSETPFSLKGQNWNQVKEGISRAVSVYLQ